MNETPLSASSASFRKAAGIIVVSSVMFTFISYWRTAAVVLCDLASTAYYIGGIVESAIGPAAPWFILAVMLFSYAVRSVYIESCSLFVRGGVYRVVKEAMGGILAKFSVSALMFDYILTGPTSGVSAGQYMMGLVMQTLKLTFAQFGEPLGIPEPTEDAIKRWGAVVLAIAITLYFFRQNLIGIHESSEKALKIMIATTIMAVIIIGWCLVTLFINGASNSVPFWPDMEKKVEHAEVWIVVVVEKPKSYRIASKENVKSVVSDKPEILSAVPSAEKPDEVVFTAMAPGEASLKIVDVKDGVETIDFNVYKERPERYPAGVEKVWIANPKRADRLQPEMEHGEPKPKESEALKKLGIEAQEDPIGFFGFFTFHNALRSIGILGLLMAFGHSILAMSGEETLAQVYREVESPKMLNFKKAAFIVFVYSILLTAGISFLAVLIIPDEVRMKFYSENLIGGLARHVIGPATLKLFLEAFVVIIGFLILAGAVNTAIIGSNGVLNRIAEDGVLPDWFLKPHPTYGTTYRLLILIAAMQIGVILFSQGDMIVLGEAYAFGVVWSFTFKALAMVVLRFKDPRPREYRVPFNFKVGSIEVPVGLLLIFLVLLIAAVLNLFTKPVATVGGLGFALVFFAIFLFSEHHHEKRKKGEKHKHLEQFNQASAEGVSLQSLNLTKPYRKLVAIRSTQNLYMLEKALSDTDPNITDVVVMTAKSSPTGEANLDPGQLDNYDVALMSAVVERAEALGKQVHPLLVPTNNPVYALLRTAKDLHVQELVIGASNKFTADEQLDQVALLWINLNEGTAVPLTVRILSQDRDLHFDLGGGNRIPRAGESKARSIAELRKAGVGADRVLLVQQDSRSGLDVFEAILTTIDPEVGLKILMLPPELNIAPADALHVIEEQAKQVGRKVAVQVLEAKRGEDIVQQAKDGGFDLIVLPLPDEMDRGKQFALPEWIQFVLQNARCRVLLVANPVLPTDLAE
jgi:amino acid transporter/nucleotide-binding universal stress UspA family protein